MLRSAVAGADLEEDFEVVRPIGAVKAEEISPEEGGRCVRVGG